jgi:hypothetical protein
VRQFSYAFATKAAFPALRIRAYQVLTDERLYRKLLAAGVDLICPPELAKTARLLGRAALQGEQP